MKLMRSTYRRAAAAALAVAAFGVAGVAQARDNIFWNVGIDAAPGVTLGVGNTRPVVVAPAPLYVAPQPVYVAPQPVYVRPAPVYYAEPVYVGPRGVPGRGWHRGHHLHHHHRR